VTRAERRQFELLQRQVAELMKRVAELERENADLRARLGMNSQNSSKPPSSDGPDAPPRAPREPSGRRPGGQPGHEKNERALLPRADVDEIISAWPESCGACGHELAGNDEAPRRHQVIDLPPIQPVVTEYELHRLTCSRCGRRTEASLPSGVPSRCFGPTIVALVALCTGKYRLSKRLVQQLLADLLGLDVSLGSVANLEQEISAALSAPVERARQHVREQPVANMDETGWYEGIDDGRKRRAWLWVAVAGAVTVYRIVTSRATAVAKEMLGPEFRGILGTDRWGAYNWVGADRRQLCWAHLVRDFRGFVERGGAGAPIGSDLLVLTELMFDWWHRIRDGTMSRRRFRQLMRPVREQVVDLLRNAVVRAEPKTAGMAREMLALKAALFTFVDVDGVEPTNNVSERQIRPGVMLRRTTFGTHCEDGSRYTERILTVVATLKQQRRNVLQFLVAAYRAHLEGRRAPSLLPRQA
jgi:transposase